MTKTLNEQILAVLKDAQLYCEDIQEGFGADLGTADALSEDINELIDAIQNSPKDKHTIDHVKEFHTVYGHPIAETPTIPDAKTRLLRVKLIAEEFMEFAKASGFPMDVVFQTGKFPGDKEISYKSVTPEHDTGEVDIVDVADGLADIDYVTQGANLVWGFPAQKIMEEVQASNMSKLDENGKPIYNDSGKVIK